MYSMHEVLETPFEVAHERGLGQLHMFNCSVRLPMSFNQYVTRISPNIEWSHLIFITAELVLPSNRSFVRTVWLFIEKPSLALLTSMTAATLKEEGGCSVNNPYANKHRVTKMAYWHVGSRWKYTGAGVKLILQRCRVIGVPRERKW